ncbi:DedA family protein [Rothia sp. CCM 9416]|uniref:DedA family protein n=1 Tax=Rothia sp. CCM 9416 TaxID=3402655 RepID=UPI003AE5E40C
MSDSLNSEENSRSMSDQQRSLPSFLTNPGRTDKILLGMLGFMTLFWMAFIPMKAFLLVEHPWVLALVTGSGFGTLSAVAQSPGQYLQWAVLIALVALSHIKFLAVYFLIGKHWGQEFITWVFSNRTPLWYRALEGFVQRHLWISLFLCFIPFSPVPATLMVAIAGIRRVRGWTVGIYLYGLALLNKSFYLYLGAHFGENIQPTLKIIDRYMMQITLALLLYVFVVNWWKGSKKQKEGR